MVSNISILFTLCLGFKHWSFVAIFQTFHCGTLDKLCFMNIYCIMNKIGHCWYLLSCLSRFECLNYWCMFVKLDENCCFELLLAMKKREKLLEIWFAYFIHLDYILPILKVWSCWLIKLWIIIWHKWSTRLKLLEMFWFWKQV